MFSCLPGALRVSTRNDFVLKSFVNAFAGSLLRERGRIIPEPWHRVRRAVLRPLLSPEGVQKDHGRGRQQNQVLAGTPVPDAVRITVRSCLRVTKRSTFLCAICFSSDIASS